MYIRHFCPPTYDCFVFLPSVGASSGSIIIWKSSIFSGVGYFKRKQKNTQAHGYQCSFHPRVFQSIDFQQGTVDGS